MAHRLSSFLDLQEGSAAFLDASQAGEHGLPLQERPRLLSAREANVANLSLSGVDLRACRFARAQGLDQLRLEADCDFAEAPSDWRHTKRRTLAEEHHWRSEQQANDGGWHRQACRLPAWLTSSDRPVEVLDPPRIAALYRSLRKALEASKDEPGAGDFYYGEMEMRRQRRAPKTAAAPTRGRGTSNAERRIVGIYWLLSGYGLRASRALLALLVVIALSTVLFHLYGFQDREHPYAVTAGQQPQSTSAPTPPPGMPEESGLLEAGLYSVGTATAIVGAPEAQLTQAGRAIRIALRILSPLLIALALLAVRGRVKR